MNQYKWLLENCSDLIVGLDENSCVFEINTHAEMIFNSSKKRILGKNLFSFCQEENIELTLSENYFKSTLIKLNKSILVLITVNKIQHRYLFKCFTQDIKLKTITFLLGQKIISTTIHENYLKHIIENLPQYIYWKDPNCVYLGCNKRVSDYLALKSPDEIIGKNDYDFGWSNERVNFLQESDSIVLNEKKEVLIEDEIPLAGTIRTMLTNKSPLFGRDGELLGIIGVTVDITDRKKLEKELLIAKEQAEAADKAKTEFIANMSHDIRTPLTGVIGLSEILEQTLQNPEEKEKAHLLHDSGEELLHMLNDILDDVRANHLTEHDIKKESFDLYQCIADLIRLESPATMLKGLALKSNIAESLPQYICSDRNKIHRILLNLMGNAIKFTQSGQISLNVDCLHCDEKEAHLKFSVSDTGIGIPQEAQSQVFNRFFKVTSSYKGLYKGHGLGLHIAQSYVELLGGHITLTSTVGVGTTFHFDIVCDVGEAPEASNNKDIPFLLNSPVQEKACHLLLVEDNVVALKTLEFILKEKGYTFISATSGEEAWSLLQKETFDAMITDIGLPGISGTQLSKNLRNQETEHNKPSLPIIGLTGHAKETALKECLQNGMNTVFTKPASIHTLHPCIQQLIQQQTESNPDKFTILSKAPSFSVDLPNTEEELFQLDNYPLFDENSSQISDKQMLISLIKAYLSDDMQNDIKVMQTRYQQGDWQEVERLAHKIKGGVTYLGTQKMRYACQYLERYYKAGHRKLLEPLYQQLITVNNDTNNALLDWLDNNAN